MPGHVTADGFKINDGDCPYYLMMKIKAGPSQVDEPAGATVQQPQPQPQPRAGSQRKGQQTRVIPAPREDDNRSVVLTHQGENASIVTGESRITLSRTQALRLARDILDEFVE